MYHFFYLLELEIMTYCSITSNNKSYCYSLKSLRTILNAWNFLNPDKNKIILNENELNNPDIIFQNLEKKFNLYTITLNNNYWAWIDIIKLINKNTKNNYKIHKIMNKIEKNDLRPAQPEEWINNKYEWLSNFDIENVLNQFNKKKDLKYKFYGVFTIDFGIKDNSYNTCKYGNNCNINMKDIIKSGKKYFGFITNLCKYNEPGTHWTSSFFILDPSFKSYGGYYYDSVKRPIPELLKPVFLDIQKQMNSIYPNKKFNIQISNVKHQNSNTECGVFSIAFQRRWLVLLYKNKENAYFDKVINFNKMNDNVMYLLRNVFFRPNVKTILKKKL